VFLIEFFHGQKKPDETTEFRYTLDKCTGTLHNVKYPRKERWVAGRVRGGSLEVFIVER
jgi:hypothetical protein